MFNRFIEIVNGLAYQGHPITSPMKVNKLLRGLSKDWNHVKTSIRETQRIMPLSVDELIGTLQSYEVEQLNDEDPEGKKSIALISNAVFDETESENDMDDEEFAFMVEKFKKLSRKERKFSGRSQYKHNGQKRIMKEDDEQRNLCLMAHSESESNSDRDSESESDSEPDSESNEEIKGEKSNPKEKEKNRDHLKKATN